MVVHFDEKTFDEAVRGEKPVLVDFWATWCGPCRMIAPAVEEVAADFEGRAVVGKVDVDEQTELARRFGIMSIPTLVVMKYGLFQNRDEGRQGRRAGGRRARQGRYRRDAGAAPVKANRLQTG